MSPLKPPSKPDRKRTGLGAMSLLMAVPAILIAAPGVGFFAGRWADKRLETDPIFTIFGLILGFGAAAREIINLVRKAQAMEEENEKK